MALFFRGVVAELQEALPFLPWLGVPFHYGHPVVLLYGPCFVPRPVRERVRREAARWGVAEEELVDFLGDLLGPLAPALLDAPAGIHLPETVEEFWAAPEELARRGFELLRVSPDPDMVEAAACFLGEHQEAIRALLSRHGFEVMPRVVAQFLVLHELGHYVDWASAPDREAWELEALSVSWDLSGHGYRAMPREARADRFALAHLRMLYPRGPLSRLARGVLRLLAGGGDV